MRIHLEGRKALLHGPRTMILEAIAAALVANGGTIIKADDGGSAIPPDILVIGHPGQDGASSEAERLGSAMSRRGSGRIVFVTSAFAAVPSRRFPELSIAAGATVLLVRTLAMRLAPSVLVNAVGCGAVGGPDGTLLAGDASMLSHVPSGQVGAVSDIVAAVLFLCDPLNSYMTGQMLTVDGGWSTGYGRNF